MSVLSIETKKVTELTQIENLTDSSVLMVHDGNGLKTVTLGKVAGMVEDESAHSYNYGKEISLTWDEISTKTKKGDFSGLRIGDYKTVALTTGEVVIMEIAGIDTYFGSGDQEAGHHILWVSRDCLATTYQMRANNTNNGTSEERNPYRASALFSTLQNTIFPTVPAEIRAHVVEMRGLLENRYSSSGTLNNSTNWAWYSRGKAILLTPIEVLGTAGWGESGWNNNGGGINVHMPLFAGSSKHVIKRKGNGGERVSWWLAAASAGNSTHFCRVDSDGSSNISNASDPFGVPLSFFTS